MPYDRSAVCSTGAPEHACSRDSLCSIGVGNLSGDQAGADVVRVEKILERMPPMYVEMQPSDGLTFHCNTLHRSDANRSDSPRWSMICRYNVARTAIKEQAQFAAARLAP